MLAAVPLAPTLVRIPQVRTLQPGGEGSAGLECDARVRARPRYLVAGLLAVAGTAHAVLTPEHFAEGTLYGVAFAVMAATQLALAAALVLRPGPAVDELGRRTTILLVALYLFARVVPVPGELEPERASLIGGLTVAVEVAALVALARLPRYRHPRLRPVTLGLVAAFATAVAVLLTTGSLRYLPGVDLNQELTGSAPQVIWRSYADGFTTESPWVALYLTNHLVVFGSLFTLSLTALLAAEVGIGAARSRRARLAGHTETRHWFWMPAMLAAPVCCGAPLLGIVGTSAFAFLLRYGWAPLALAVVVGWVSLALGAQRDAASGRSRPGTRHGQEVR
jgi:hypothetical protein